MPAPFFPFEKKQKTITGKWFVEERHGLNPPAQSDKGCSGACSGLTCVLCDPEHEWTALSTGVKLV